MKKTLILCILPAAVAAALCTGCKTEERYDSGDSFVISVEQDSRDFAKTTLSPDYEVLWQAGDKISVNGTISSEVASQYVGGKVAEFAVSGSLTAPYKVIYPGTTSTNQIVIPGSQTYVAGTFPAGSAPAFGNAVKNGDDYGVRLSNFCGILRLALNGTATLSKIVFTSLDGNIKLSGAFTLATDGDGFTGAFSGGTSGSITLNFSPELALSTSEDTYFFMPVPAQAYNGIEARIYQSDGAFMRLTFCKNGYEITGTDVLEFPSKTFMAGHAEDIVAINDLTAQNGGEPTSTPPGITVATFNVMRLDDDNRPAAATSGDTSGKIARPANAIVKDCAEMKEALGLAIYNTAADLIGFNEIGDDMYASGQAYSLEDIAEAQGASYTWKLNFPGSESGNYHYCNGFAYKSTILTLNESGKAWLRYNSESYSTSSASNSGDPNRFVVWAKFTHKVSGKVFYFFVTQLPTHGQDGGSGTSNTNMSGGVNAFATAKAGSYPQILVGDMNSAPGHSSEAGYNKLKTYWTDAYEAVSAAGNLASFYGTYSGTQSGTGDTFQYSILQFTKNHPERRIDHIMTHGACTAQSYRTVRNVYEFGSGESAVTCCPSDHFPVVSYITLD